jgi:uncharacterized phage protein gp47/JayE
VAGAVVALANSLDVISTPVYGWATVNNVAAASVGQTEETDPELRARRTRVAERSSSVSVSALHGAISDVSGVTLTKVVQNVTESTDANGVPAHSVWCIVLGGADADIAEAIFTHLAAGIGTYGDSSYNYADATTGETYTIYFERPADVNVYVAVEVLTDQDYPADGDDLIETAVEDYFDDNQGLGDDVHQSRLYTPVNEVAGHTVNSIYIDTAASPTSTDTITIADNQRAVAFSVTVSSI